MTEALRLPKGFDGGLVEATDVAMPPPPPELIDFESVEDRLIEAFRTLAALPDPAPGPQLRTMALWREVMADRTDIDNEPTPGRPGVSRYEMRRMEEALAWCEWLGPDARRIVGAAISWQASAPDGQVRELRWTVIRHRLRVQTTTEGLRKAYSRALSRICGKLNAGR